MAQLQAVSGAERQQTVTDRLIKARSSLRNSHGRLSSVASRAGLLTPTPTGVTKEAPECADLNGVVLDIEHLCEMITQYCAEVEKIA